MTTFRARVLGIVILSTALALPGCISAPDTTVARLVRTELYFGRSMPDGKEVSDAEWKEFLDKEVTPRFREGLTVLDGAGQYLNQSGTLITEKTKVLILIHPDSPDRTAAVLDVISAYKRRFQQESVLRVRDRVGVSF